MAAAGGAALKAADGDMAMGGWACHPPDTSPFPGW